MIDLNELWIGDLLRIKSSGRIGKFAGIHKSGKARISSNDKIYLATARNLEYYQQEEEPNAQEQWVKSLNKEKTTTAWQWDTNTIDLHAKNLGIDELQAKNILPKQLISLENFLEHVKQSKLNQCTIIHGKGEGVLKAEVQERVKHLPRYSHSLEINNGGATRVYFF